MALLWKRQLSNFSSTYFVFSRQFKSSTNQNVNKNGGSCKWWWWSSYLSQNSRMRRAACLLLGGTAAGISCYWWCLQRPRPPWYLKIRSATGILLAPPTVHAKSKVKILFPTFYLSSSCSNFSFSGANRFIKFWPILEASCFIATHSFCPLSSFNHDNKGKRRADVS